MNRFDDYFFLIDSEHLADVHTRIYGYVVTEDGIFEDDNRGTQSFAGGCGCYVYVEASPQTIKITQDDNGSVGLYLFDKGGCFAVSNSFFKLLDHVRQRFKLTPNLDYMRHFASISLCSNAYEETAVNEIRKVDRRATLLIDTVARKLAIERHFLPLHTVALDSAEGFRVLDKWYAKWTRIFRELYYATNSIHLDLSGGFDSRLSFMLAVGAGLNFSDILVYSCRPTNTKNPEEYGIAEQIGQRYGFIPNNHAFNSDVEDFSLDEAVDVAYHVKMMFHKKLGLSTYHQLTKRYHIDGFGGELIRAYCDDSVQTFIQNQCRRVRRLIPGAAGEKCSKSIDIVLNRSCERLQKNLPASQFKDGVVRCLYQNTISGNHHGKISWEQYLSGVISLSPLMDPDLQVLRLTDEVCADRNLLVALMYERYGLELLQFPFERGRSIAVETLRHAGDISRRFLRADAMFASYRVFEVNIQYGRKHPKAKARLQPSAVEDCLKRIFLSERARETISRHLGADLYEYVATAMSNQGWQTQIEYHAMLGCLRVLDEIEVGQSAGVQTTHDWIASYLGKGTPVSPELHSMQMTVFGSRKVVVQIESVAYGLKSVNPKGAVLVISADDAKGKPCPIAGLSYSDRFKSQFVYVPVSGTVTKWDREFAIPPGANQCKFKLIAFAVSADVQKVLSINFSEK